MNTPNEDSYSKIDDKLATDVVAERMLLMAECGTMMARYTNSGCEHNCKGQSNIKAETTDSTCCTSQAMLDCACHPHGRGGVEIVGVAAEERCQVGEVTGSEVTCMLDTLTSSNKKKVLFSHHASSPTSLIKKLRKKVYEQKS